MAAFHLPWLAGQTGAFVNGTERAVLKGGFYIFFKMAHSENGLHQYEGI